LGNGVNLNEKTKGVSLPILKPKSQGKGISRGFARGEPSRAWPKLFSGEGKGLEKGKEKVGS